MNLEQVKQYCNRIGIKEYPKVLDAEVLNQLVLSHMMQVPFENLDIYDGNKVPSLEVDDLYKKIVVNSRGGYCFELNRLFYDFLISIGWKAYPILVRIVLGRSEMPATLHRATIVKVDEQEYYCDVGFGGPAPRGVLRLDVGRQLINGVWFEIEKKGESYCILREQDGEFHPLFFFDKKNVLEVDFTVPNFYCSVREESKFKQERIVNLCTSDGSISLDGQKIKIKKKEQSDAFEIHSKKELEKVLEEYFHIRYSYEKE